MKELKASLKLKDCKVQSLQESLSKMCEQNKALEQELNTAKVKVNKQDDEIYNLWDNLDSVPKLYGTQKTLDVVNNSWV